MAGLQARSFFLFVGITLAGLSGARADDADQEGLAIEVHFQNYAGVPGGLLRKASTVADEVYRPANVAVDWLDCTPVLEGAPTPSGCGGDVRATSLVIQLIPEKMARGIPVRGTVFGFSPLGTPDQLPNRAVLFWERIQDFCLAFAVDADALLGTALAHEIGHLLLGPDKHSLQGMMRCPWQKQDVTHASRGRLRFSSDELVWVREGALRRALAEREAADGS